ncbi:MAG: hypothetical protein J0J11_06420, partial [Microbacterium sp.]|nr:hypothetical protein [Microbacterium sp.]
MGQPAYSAISSYSRVQILHQLQERPARTAEETRRQLRTMMRPSGSHARFENRSGKVFDESAGFRHYEKLRSTALTGVPAFFQTAL